MEKQWQEMTPAEKQEELFARWLSPKSPDGQPLKFQSPAAEKAYMERAIRIRDAVQLKKTPDRVPVLPMLSFFPTYYAGVSPREAMYDYDKLAEATKKYLYDFEPDVQSGIGIASSGRIFDILDYKLYAWPGHGVSEDSTYQCLEKEYMMADEYDALIRDPSYFFTNTYFPRIFGNLQGFKMLPNFATMQELPFVGPNVLPFGLPDVRAAYQSLFEAGEEALKWAGAVGAFGVEVASQGFPGVAGGFTKVPFDVIGDTLRGTRGIMLDIYRQPDKVLAAMDALTPIMIDMGVAATQMAGNPMVMIPLHKGADGFLSDAQFKKFYWPHFRQVIMGLVNEGCVPFSFVEGGYNTRLEVIRDVPKGTTFWTFDTTDMARAKKILGDVACIGGNVPTDLLAVGTAQQVEDYVKNLIDTCAPGGGYVVANGVAADQVKPENMRVMIDYTKEHGVYK
ncbi:MAG: uroporphyrinogen decarboxylase family protein [Dehalococcoidia bacterium]|jgi:uroporphyrinogen-III decarboxylase